MSKRKARASRKSQPKLRRKRNIVVGICLVLFLCLAGSILAQWRSIGGGFTKSHSLLATAAPVPQPTMPAPNSPSKEYIYAGGRLVATEESVTKSDQTITFSSISDKTYGDAAFTLGATATSGLSVSFTVVAGAVSVSGSTVTITGAGPVTIRADQAGSNGYNPAPSVMQSFMVNKATASIILGNLSQTYDGIAKPASATTTPAGLNVSLTYSQNGQSVSAPTSAGSYTASAVISDSNYQGSTTNTLVINKATATVTLSNLSYTYDGNAHAASTSTTPANLSVTLSYSQSGTAVSSPTNAGSYTVSATMSDVNYQGSVTGTLVINKATPTINWNSPADINYGTGLSSTQLNAAALFNGSSVAGNYTYTPAAGAVLGVGNNQPLSVNFTPTDTNNFESKGVSVYINVLAVAANALSVNGTTSYMQVTNSLTINLTGAFTAEAWVKTTNTTAEYQSVFERFGNPDANGNNGGFILRLHNRKLDFYVLHSSQSGLHLEGNTTLTTNVWHHIAAVCDGNQMRVYLDGALDGSISASQYLPATGTSDLFIGRGTSTYGYFGGFIDEARITASVLYTSNFTPQSQLTSGTNTRGLWKFDGSSANDFSGNGNTGTPAGAPSFSTDVATLVNNSVSFNGTSQQVRVPHATSLEVTGPFTIETWFTTSDVSTNQFLVSALTSTGGFILMNNAGAPQLYISNGTGQTDFAMAWPANITTGVWHHVAGVFDGTQIRVYLDGTLCATKNTTVTPGAFTGDLTISGFQDGVNGMAIGLVDEVRLTGSALYTANFTAERHLMATSNSKGLWKFDGQTLQDASGNSNNGTFSGGTVYSADAP